MSRKFINLSKNQIEISVCGVSASGKSTIIAIIESALIANGFNNLNLGGTNPFDDDYEFTKNNLNEKIKKIRKNDPEIFLNEVQAVATI